MELSIEKCGMLIKKNGKREAAEGIELAYQKQIRTLGEKENYKYSWMLEADIVKQAEIKDKITKSTSDERENFLKPSSAAETSSKGKSLGNPPCKPLRTILKIDKGKTQTNGPKGKKVDDNAQGLTFARLNRQTICQEGGRGLANTVKTV